PWFLTHSLPNPNTQLASRLVRVECSPYLVPSLGRRAWPDSHDPISKIIATLVNSCFVPSVMADESLIQQEDAMSAQFSALFIGRVRGIVCCCLRPRRIAKCRVQWGGNKG